MGKITKYTNEAGVYKLTCIKTNKIYIGKTINFALRFRAHKNRKGKLYIQNAIMKYGWESFEVEILDVFKGFDKNNEEHKLLILLKEAEYIKLYNSTDRAIGYNICKYSSDKTGVPLSEDTKEKLRVANLGKKHTPETKKKMSESALGRHISEETKEKLRQYKLKNPLSEENKEKLRQSVLGKPLSEEHREKLRKAKLGKKHSEKTLEKMRQSKLGKKHSEERKEQMRQTRVKNRGNK